MIRTKPMGHQTDIVKFCAPKNYAGIFADYGTGKTLAALIIIQLRKFKKVLIVSTKTAIDTTWCDQIREHSDFRFCVLRGTAKHKVNTLGYALNQVDSPQRYGVHQSSGKPMLFLINYEAVKSIFYELQRAGFDAVFVDESTKIKTFDSERTMALFEVGKFIPNRYIMTGFPVTEALFELYSQIRFLDLGETFGKSYYAFLNKHFVRSGPKTIVKKKSIKQILDMIKPFCIRITNKSLKLPPALYKPVHIEATDQQMQLLEELNSTFRINFKSVNIDTQYIFALLEKSLEICDGFVQHKEYEYIEKDGKLIRTNKVISESLELVETNKDQVLIDTLDEIDVTKNKVVIWCSHKFSVLKLRKILTKVYGSSGVKVLTLTGETEDVNTTVQRFQKTHDCNILVCTLKKASESVTLTSARYAIYYSNVWSNDMRLNSEARVRRKGSEKHESIIYTDLLIKGTIEEKVYDCLKKKKNLIDELKHAFLEMKG